MLAQLLSSSTGISYILDQIAASVAPPILIMRRFAQSETARMRAGSDSGIQSPLKNINRRELGSLTLLFSATHTINSMNAGTEFHNVMQCSWTRSSHTFGSGGLKESAGGTTMQPPAARSPKISYTDKSKLSDDKARTRSEGPTSNLSFKSKIVFKGMFWKLSDLPVAHRL